MSSPTSWFIAVYQGIKKAPPAHAFSATVYVPHADNEKRLKGYKEALPVRFTASTADAAEDKARQHVLDFQAQAKRMSVTSTKGGKPESFPYAEEFREAIVAWKDAFKEVT